MNGVFAAVAVSGLVFWLGLIASGMTNPAKLKGSLDLFGAWDTSVAFVMAGAIGVGVLAFPWPAAASGRGQARRSTSRRAPSSIAVCWLGVPCSVWVGVSPAFARGRPSSRPAPAPAALGFVAAMLVSMFVHDRWLLRH